MFSLHIYIMLTWLIEGSEIWEKQKLIIYENNDLETTVFKFAIQHWLSRFLPETVLRYRSRSFLSEVRY